MSNIETIKEQLSELTEKISTDDRLLAAVELKVHLETIHRYMRGEIKKESFALELLGFLKARIAEREKALAK